MLAALPSQPRALTCRSLDSTQAVFRWTAPPVARMWHRQPAKRGQPATSNHPLADLAQKKSLTDKQAARVSVWVTQAVSRLQAAGSLAAMNAIANQQFLDPAVTTKASKAFMDARAKLHRALHGQHAH